MSAKLKELQEKRNTCFGKISELRDEFNKNDQQWKDEEQRKAWEDVNADYDSADKGLQEEMSRQAVDARFRDLEELQKQSDRERSGRGVPGLDDRSGRRDQDDDDSNPLHRMKEDEISALALQGFLRNIGGLDVDERQAEALKRCKVNPNSKQVDFRLGTNQFCRGLQREWSSVHQSQALRSATKWAESRDLSSITASAGGATVPSTLIRMLEINMLAFGGIRQVADTIITNSGEPMAWPTADDTGNTGEQIGENTSVGASVDPTFGAVTWGAFKFSSKPILVPYELLEDSAFDLASRLGEMLGERLGRITATKHTTGTGAGTCKGIVTAATLGKTTAGAAAITADEILDLIHSVDPAYRTGAGFMFHDNILLYLRKLVDANSQYLWQPGMQLGIPDRIFGYPFTISQEMASSIATGNKTALFGQLSKQKIRRVNGIRLKRLDERYADTDQVAFLALLREDSNLLDAGTAPVKYLQQL